MAEPKNVYQELIELLELVDHHSDPDTKYNVFAFIRRVWEELGENTDVQEKVCERLKISRHLFSMYLSQPELCYGLEVVHKHIKDGWLASYLEYTAGSEAPEDFHLWVGMTVLAMALGRKVWYDDVYYKLYPNLYTILVSPPGVGKKTTAIEIGSSLLIEACPDIKIIAEKATPEALAVRLAAPSEAVGESGHAKIESKAEALLLAPELTTFLGREQYLESLVITLTRLYDCASKLEVSTIKRKVETARNVFACLLGGTTPDELTKALPSSASGGGLLSRTNIIQKDSSPRAMARAVRPDPTLREFLVSKLRKIHKETSGPFEFTTDGWKWYEEYYKNWKRLLESGAIGRANIERQASHIIKVGIIMCVSEDRKALDEDVLQRSFNILDMALRSTGDVVRIIDASFTGKMMELIVSTIKMNGGSCTQSQLMHRLYRKITKKELEYCMETLNEANVVKSWFGGPSGRTKFHRLVTLTDKGEKE